jgi:hypothetical protein
MALPDTLYLHVGLPKTATTYLQKEVFPSLSSSRYLGIPQGMAFSGPEKLESGPRTLTNCVKRSALLWESYGDAVFQDLFGCRCADRPPGNVLLSDEGVGRAGSRPTLLSAHLKGIAAQARSWGFGRFRVLCVFRRQDHWLASHYAQISDRNPQASQAHFEASVQRKLDPVGERFGFGMLLDYAALGHAIHQAVGASDVLMLPYELLVHDSTQFHEKVLSFLGEETGPATFESTRKQNVRSTQEGVWELRPSRRSQVVRLRPGRLFASLGLPDELHLSWRTSGGSIQMTEPVSTSILREYEDSNRTLADAIDLDLAPYGYFPRA